MAISNHIWKTNDWKYFGSGADIGSGFGIGTGIGVGSSIICQSSRLSQLQLSMLIVVSFDIHNHTISLNMKSGNTKNVKCDEDGHHHQFKNLDKVWWSRQNILPQGPLLIKFETLVIGDTLVVALALAVVWRLVVALALTSNPKDCQGLRTNYNYQL